MEKPSSIGRETSETRRTDDDGDDYELTTTTTTTTTTQTDEEPIASGSQTENPGKFKCNCPFPGAHVLDLTVGAFHQLDVVHNYVIIKIVQSDSETKYHKGFIIEEDQDPIWETMIKHLDENLKENDIYEIILKNFEPQSLKKLGKIIDGKKGKIIIWGKNKKDATVHVKATSEEEEEEEEEEKTEEKVPMTKKIRDIVNDENENLNESNDTEKESQSRLETMVAEPVLSTPTKQISHEIFLPVEKPRKTQTRDEIFLEENPRKKRLRFSLRDSEEMKEIGGDERFSGQTVYLEEMEEKERSKIEEEITSMEKAIHGQVYLFQGLSTTSTVSKLDLKIMELLYNNKDGVTFLRTINRSAHTYAIIKVNDRTLGCFQNCSRKYASTNGERHCEQIMNYFFENLKFFFEKKSLTLFMTNVPCSYQGFNCIQYFLGRPETVWQRFFSTINIIFLIRDNEIFGPYKDYYEKTLKKLYLKLKETNGRAVGIDQCTNDEKEAMKLLLTFEKSIRIYFKFIEDIQLKVKKKGESKIISFHHD